MLILFLTGATVTFRPLLDHILLPKFIKFLTEKGFDRITIQYGNEIVNGRHISKEYVSKLLDQYALMEELNLQIVNETNDKSVITMKNNDFQLQLLPFATNITSYVASADLVVSHGGTGSILDALRLGKPLLVVTNDKLMDNHQQEVADQFEAENHLLSCSCSDLKDLFLETAIADFEAGALTFTQLETPPPGIIQCIFDQTLP